MQNEHTRYIVRKKTPEVPGVVTLSFTDENDCVPSFISGQYINIYFPELNTPEGKAYSISSAPGESTFSITVRAIGEFSNRLYALSPGDAINASLPYGFFYPEREDSDVVMLAAGIGIAPFRSMLRDIASKDPVRQFFLFYSMRTSSDSVFKEEFENLQTKLSNFSLAYFITREKIPAPQSAIQRRIEAEDILSRVVDVEKTEFLMCGSISFTRDMWRALRYAGVPEDRMYTEAFFSH